MGWDLVAIERIEYLIFEQSEPACHHARFAMRRITARCAGTSCKRNEEENVRKCQKASRGRREEEGGRGRIQREQGRAWHEV